MAFQFGSGIVWCTPTGGNQATNPTPLELGTIESASVEFSGSLKELIGFLQFPDDVAVGEKKVTGKITMGRIDALTFNNVFFADTAAAGSTNANYNFAATVPGTPFQITITPPGGGTFVGDLGVIYSSTTNGNLAGQRLTKAATASAKGIYSQSGAVYTFNTADATSTVWISYTYSLAATGNTYQINNQTMGYGPVISLDLLWGYQGGYQGAANALGIHLYAARISKLSLAAKNTDYVKPEFDYSAFANASNQVGYIIQSVA